MTNRRNHRYRTPPGRRVWVFSESNADGRHEQIAMVLTTAGLEQARLEAEARAADKCREREDVTHYDAEDFSKGAGDVHA